MQGRRFGSEGPLIPPGGGSVCRLRRGCWRPRWISADGQIRGEVGGGEAEEGGGEGE